MAHIYLGKGSNLKRSLQDRKRATRFRAYLDPRNALKPMITAIKAILWQTFGVQVAARRHTFPACMPGYPKLCFWPSGAGFVA